MLNYINDHLRDGLTDIDTEREHRKRKPKKISRKLRSKIIKRLPCNCTKIVFMNKKQAIFILFIYLFIYLFTYLFIYLF